jgi:hypothetical protein
MKTLIAVTFASLLSAEAALACNGATGKYSCTTKEVTFIINIKKNDSASLDMEVPGLSLKSLKHGQSEVEEGITYTSSCVGNAIVIKESAGSLKAENRIVISADKFAAQGTAIGFSVDVDEFDEPISAYEYFIDDATINCSKVK